MDWLDEILAQQGVMGQGNGLAPGLLGSVPMQQFGNSEQLAHLLGGARNGAAQMAAQSEQANAQAAQANRAANAQREAQDNATMQQAQQATEQQRQREQAAAKTLLSIGITAATGGLGGGATEAAAGGAGEAAAAAEGAKMLEAANTAAGFTPEALGISAVQATPNILNGVGWGTPLRKWF